MIEIKRKEDGKPWVAEVAEAFPARTAMQIYVSPVNGMAASGQYINLEKLFELFDVEITTYGELYELLGSFTPEQLDANITTEISWDNECFPCELRIAGSEHDSLDEGHPVLYVKD